MDRFMNRIFKQIEAYPQEAFQFEVKLEKKDWLNGTSTVPTIFTNLIKNSNHNLDTDKEWTKLDSSKEQVIALTTEVHRLKKDLVTKGKSNGKPGKTGGNRVTPPPCKDGLAQCRVPCQV
jgi:hypothetical protein